MDASKKISLLKPKKCSPRGKHNPRDPSARPKRLSPQAEEPTYKSLCQILKKNPEVIEHGMECISKYIQRNTPFVTMKAISLNIFAGAVSSGMGIIEACELSSACMGYSSETIRLWAVSCFRDFFGDLSCLEDVDNECLETELSSNRGKHPKIESLFHDKTFQLEAREYVREHAYKRGEPNLTVHQFMKWIQDTWEVEVCEETIRLWLHKLGFTYKQFSKGVYFDRHERSDVVEHRKAYLEALTLHGPRMLTADCSTPDPDSPLKPIIRVFHDESTFYCNSDQTFHWTDGSSQALKQKSLGQAIMVSDFVEEVGGYLRFGSQEARILLEHQSEGYFTNEMFIDQVKTAIDIFEMKYPEHQGLFIFDNAPSHRKKPPDSLNAEKMNISDGGKQPHMRDTVWRGRLQRMVMENGQQKGMKRVLEERGVETAGMNAEKMREELNKFEVQDPI